ncbi:hypothetical protein A2U01_0060786, partial [Trifolium medium]|nr:hypothetical protein [Trifolium medium]
NERHGVVSSRIGQGEKGNNDQNKLHNMSFP